MIGFFFAIPKRLTMYKFIIFILTVFSMSSNSQSIRIATFNASMEATNYVEQEQTPAGDELQSNLRGGEHKQIKNIADIIQRTRPDIVLLNEFDYSKQSATDVQNFMKHYLTLSQANNKPIDYPYFYSAPVNTGVDSGLDLDKDGIASGTKGDAFGFGLFPGHYGMLVLSKYPIQFEEIRTFQHLLWKDMPGNHMTTIKDENGKPYYSQQAQQILRLSSKSHWDIPIKVGNRSIHLLASHPTPPVFDGPENRNGKRNHDEIRFWTDYLSGSEQSAYIYDDNQQRGGFKGEHFVIAGDLNASPDEGDGIKRGIQGLLVHHLVNDSIVPQSEGGSVHTPDNPYSAQHTAEWAMRADYVLPSTSLNVTGSGVFWPKPDDSLFRLIKDRQSSSDHRLVWVDIAVTK
jgi:endonuclease/exonuclease/phosphatase family metal-dependent hydrolase